jgi:hypothetical protein
VHGYKVRTQDGVDILYFKEGKLPSNPLAAELQGGGAVGSKLKRKRVGASGADNAEGKCRSVGEDDAAGKEMNDGDDEGTGTDTYRVVDTVHCVMCGADAPMRMRVGGRWFFFNGLQGDSNSGEVREEEEKDGAQVDGEGGGASATPQWIRDDTPKWLRDAVDSPDIPNTSPLVQCIAWMNLLG